MPLRWVSWVIFGGALCSAGERVTDEALRLKVLRLVFQGARITTLKIQAAEKAHAVRDPAQRVMAYERDALHEGPLYRVTGPVAEVEENSAKDLLHPDLPPSEKRSVEMQLYRWDAAGREPLLVAMMTYTFPKANPARCCHTIGKVLLLSKTADRILDVLDQMPNAFGEFTEIRFVKVKGALEKLMIGVDASYAGAIGTHAAILDVRGDKLAPLVSVTKVWLYELDENEMDVHTLLLDEKRTFEGAGKTFYFTETSYWRDGEYQEKALKRAVSYPVGTGVPLEWGGGVFGSPQQ